VTILVEVEHADGHVEERHIEIERMYNFGSATRVPDDALAHQEEVAKAGVGIAFDIPAPRVYPISPRNLVSDAEVFVHNSETSGEVEIVLLRDGAELLIGVGSDHTDRRLERHSIVWSKQAYPNVVARRFWPMSDIRDHWDNLVLESWVDGRSYQHVGVDIFLHPDDLLSELNARVAALPARFILFSGTYVSVDKALGFGRQWRFRLSDPTLGRSIGHTYTLTNIIEEIVEAHRVPLAR